MSLLAKNCRSICSKYAIVFNF